MARRSKRVKSLCPCVKKISSLPSAQWTSFQIVSEKSPQHVVFTISWGPRSAFTPDPDSASKTKMSYVGITESPGKALM